MSNKVVCFGEVLYDVYPDGKRIGGAPFNVAAHLKQLGNESYIITRIGEDGNGSELISAIGGYTIPTDTVQIDNRLPTGIVNVTLDQEGKATYDIKEPSSWDNISASKKDLTLVTEAEAFVFGSLACRSSRSRSSLFKFAENYYQAS